MNANKIAWKPASGTVLNLSINEISMLMMIDTIKKKIKKGIGKLNPKIIKNNISPQAKYLEVSSVQDLLVNLRYNIKNDI